MARQSSQLKTFVIIGFVTFSFFVHGEEGLHLEKIPFHVDFNSMIDENNKESLSLSQNVNQRAVELENNLANNNSNPQGSPSGDDHRVKEFLQVEMGLGDASSYANQPAKSPSEPGTQVHSKEDLIFEENMEFRDENFADTRGPSSVASSERESNHSQWRKVSRTKAPAN